MFDVYARKNETLCVFQKNPFVCFTLVLFFSQSHKHTKGFFPFWRSGGYLTAAKGKNSFVCEILCVFEFLLSRAWTESQGGLNGADGIGATHSRTNQYAPLESLASYRRIPSVPSRLPHLTPRGAAGSNGPMRPSLVRQWRPAHLLGLPWVRLRSGVRGVKTNITKRHHICEIQTK